MLWSALGAWAVVSWTHNRTLCGGESRIIDIPSPGLGVRVAAVAAAAAGLVLTVRRLRRTTDASRLLTILLLGIGAGGCLGAALSLASEPNQDANIGGMLALMAAVPLAVICAVALTVIAARHRL